MAVLCRAPVQIALKAQRAAGTTHFICGNHDFAFACYLGCVDWSTSRGLDLDGVRFATVSPSLACLRNVVVLLSPYVVWLSPYGLY